MLFIAGMSPKSSDAVDNLRKICDSYLDGNFELRIIDITLEKHLAVDYQIIGIPTLIKTHPGATRTILGDLSETEKVLRILDIE